MPIVERIKYERKAEFMKKGKVRPAWPNVYERSAFPLYVYLTYWDIVETGTLLTQASLRGRQPYRLWTFSADRSWVAERCFAYIRDEDDWRFAEEVCRAADGIIVSEYHNYPINWKGVLPKKMAVYHHGMFLRQNHKKLNMLEKRYGYKRFVSTPDLLLYGDDMEWLPFAVPIDELTQMYPRERRWRKKLIVGHGYTIAENKGTDKIVQVLKELEREGKIELRVWTGLTRRESLWHLRQCDIYVATLLYGPGVATVEAWAMGIPTVLGCNSDELEMQKLCYGKDLPFAYATEHTLKRVLNDLLMDQCLRDEYVRRGKRCLQYHEANYVWQKLVKSLQNWEPTKKGLQWDGS